MKSFKLNVYQVVAAVLGLVLVAIFRDDLRGLIDAALSAPATPHPGMLAGPPELPPPGMLGPMGPPAPPSPPLHNQPLLIVTVLSAFLVVLAGSINPMRSLRIFRIARYDRAHHSMTNPVPLRLYLTEALAAALEQPSLRFAVLISGSLGIMLWFIGTDAFMMFGMLVQTSFLLGFMTALATALFSTGKALRFGWISLWTCLVASAASEVALRTFETAQSLTL